METVVTCSETTSFPGSQFDPRPSWKQIENKMVAIRVRTEDDFIIIRAQQVLLAFDHLIERLGRGVNVSP